ncbi:MAG TPA: hypothetical protein PKZ12_08275, partial [Smithellaceae bacterium]|nr:hypothetical protein [Smithellaceae bacterium]
MRKEKSNLLPAVFCSVFGHFVLAVLLFFGSAGSFAVTVNMNNKPELVWMSLAAGDTAAAVPDRQTVQKAPQEAARAADAVAANKQSNEVIREKVTAVPAADRAKSVATANQEETAPTFAGGGESQFAAVPAALPVVKAT